MKYVITAAEAARFTGLTPSMVCTMFRSDRDGLPHIWETADRTCSDLRIMSFPFINYLKGHMSDEKIKRLRKYIEA